jgi:hypothetical protein
MDIVYAVAVFAVLSAAFELIVLLKIPLRPRVWLFHHAGLVHMLVFGVNMAVHYGTVTGSMVAVTAGLASFATMPLAIHISLWILRRQQGG